MLMHPFRPELVGRTLGDFKDANGTPLYRNAVNVAKANGAGFIRYVWPRPGEDRPLPKLTRVSSFQPWGWIFLNGVYVDDIDTAFRQSLIRSGTILAAVALMLSGVVIVINRGLQRSLGGEPDYAPETARRIASGDLSVPVAIRGTGERSLLYAMEEMRTQLARTIGAIKGSTESITSATQEIAVGNSDLNAAVEAARVGEQGRGFAVVASEVRSLALRAAAAAKDVKVLIQESVTRVESGSALVSETGTAIREIVGAVKRVDSIVHEIAVASNEQSTGIKQVGLAISRWIW